MEINSLQWQLFPIFRIFNVFREKKVFKIGQCSGVLELNAFLIWYFDQEDFVTRHKELFPDKLLSSIVS